MQVGGPLADEEGLEKSSSDGLVKELLIWQHRALILLSPSPGIPISISSTSKKGTHRGRQGGKRSRSWRKLWRGRQWKRVRRRSEIGDEEDGVERQTNREREKKYLFICITDPVIMKSIETGACEVPLTIYVALCT